MIRKPKQPIVYEGRVVFKQINGKVYFDRMDV